eukprot:jgi/Picsp_1/6664/NSC_04007-R1_---NA---
MTAQMSLRLAALSDVCEARTIHGAVFGVDCLRVKLALEEEVAVWTGAQDSVREVPVLLR